MPDFIDGTELLKRLKAEIHKADCVDIAVAFWGAGATKQLGLRSDKKVRVICNLMSGGTNPVEIRELRRLNADVRQLSDLHAKIGVVGNMSFVGSSNMSANGLGAEGKAAVWQEANVVYDKRRPEILEMFRRLWDEATEIVEADLEFAHRNWVTRQRANTVIAANKGNRSLVDVLRTAPAELDALNVRMVVYDTVTDEEDLAAANKAEMHAHKRYGRDFTVYWGWDSMKTDAQMAYLVSFDWPARGQIARGKILCRNAEHFPDFEQNGKTYYAAYQIPNIEGITFGTDDKKAIQKAFSAYVRAGEKGEEDNERAYIFPISELARYLPPED